MLSADVRTELDLQLCVADRRVAADGVVVVTLEDAAGAPLPPWSPGAHVDLLLAPGLVRQYSLCGDPSDARRWQVAVLHEPSGRGGSAHVHDRLDVGSAVQVRGPRNHFLLVEAPRYIFIAGGIGITPLLAMIAAAQAAGADWVLHYGGRSRASMAFLAELEALYGTRVALRTMDVDGPLDLDAALGSARADTLVYCCGPEGLLAAVEQRCASWPAASLHVERFAARPLDPNAVDRPFEVQLATTGVQLTVPADRTLLEVVREAGVVVPSSCEEGTCGTCETVVLAGRPDHRDALLTEAEKLANETMMLCVSRSLDGRLVLDL